LFVVHPSKNLLRVGMAPWTQLGLNWFGCLSDNEVRGFMMIVVGSGASAA
jgi:hypothetical protein